MATERKIVSAVVGEAPPLFSGILPAVTVTFDDNVTQELFHFYPLEPSFKAEEFIGLTAKEGRALKRTRDDTFLKNMECG